jgi:hypothetical protein
MGEDAVTGQMATWREWRAWRREFKSLGIRQVKEREARSIWHGEKQQAARWWLREQELRSARAPAPQQVICHHVPSRAKLGLRLVTVALTLSPMNGKP